MANFLAIEKPGNLSMYLNFFMKNKNVLLSQILTNGIKNKY